MEFVIKVKIKREDGPEVDEDQVLEALEEVLSTGFQFEAGDDPSVFEIDEAELAG